MRNDHRPYALKRLHLAVERAWLRHFVAPQLDGLGDHCRVRKPWYLKLHGAGISFGRSVDVIASVDRRVRLTTWAHEAGAGRIEVGDYCLISPGVRMESACGIVVGASSMIAAGAYLTDADWHDVYDRTRSIGGHGEVVLEENVWVGDGAVVCKGVRIGANSVIGAGSVVTRDIPRNVIAAGNPAAVVRVLDPGRQLVRRAALFADPAALEARMNDFDRYFLGNNTWAGWLRARLWPGDAD